MLLEELTSNIEHSIPILWTIFDKASISCHEGYGHWLNSTSLHEKTVIVLYYCLNWHFVAIRGINLKPCT